MGLWHITAHGIGGHAAHPQGTISAIGVLEDYLLEHELVSPKEAEFLRFAVKVPHASDGSLLGVDADDGFFTPLTVVSGMVYTEDAHLVQTLDFRFPTNTTAAKLQAALQAQAEGVALIEMGPAAAPFYKNPASKELRACLDAYHTVSGESGLPYTIGGGTYARHFPNAVGFGPEDPHPGAFRPAFVGSIHGANEAASFDELLEALKIYIVTLLNLEELEF